MNQQSIILFDGVCNLCNSAVQFIIKRDKKNYFRFASLQSAHGQELLSNYNLPLNDLNSFVLIENEKAYTRSTGALRVSKKLNKLWPLLYSFIIIPKFIRDSVYKWIAGNRYKWFGKKSECMIPSPQLKARFLN
ncbi:MAG: thiol-disulfide oxidoreductase DCC family protein [Chitinophagaceae bacterium]|nr:thiol-disulfide oxidoreductase DCC family protein [Chitinophagaceae bacterium]